MNNLTNPSVIKEILQKHQFHFSKKLGQNFIINPAICPRIAEEGGVGPDTGVLEIGPGIGVLTGELAARSRKVVAVELDERLIPLLGETLAEHDNVRIIQGDVLKVDLHRLIADEFGDMEVVVCANLPYYITSPIVMKLLEERLPVLSITVMVQKETAQRFCAPLPSRQAGAVTAAIAYYAKPEILFEVSPGSFLPAPKVKSSVIRLSPRATPAVEVADEALFFRVVRGAFAQRRKNLLNSLSAAFSADKDTVRGWLLEAGIPENTRPEQLTLEQFAAIARQI